VLAIYSDCPDYFREEEVKALTALADNISFAVESAENERERRRVEERLFLLNELGEAMSGLDQPDDVLPIALELIGRRLGVARCVFGTIDADGERCTVPYDYTDGCPSIVGQYRLSSFGSRMVEKFKSGDTIVICDVEKEADPDESGESFRALGIKAFVCCSLLRQGALRALMSVHSFVPRSWTADEVSLVEEFAHRCWAAIEQRAAEAKLRRNEALLRIAGRAAKLGGWTVELPDFSRTWSDEVCAIYEVPSGTTPTPEEAGAFFVPGSREIVTHSIERCFEEGTPFDHELEVITAKQRRIWVRAIGHAERDDDNRIVRVQGALQDIDDRRKLEDQFRQAQKMEAVGKLAGGVAHDFNNLLSVILGHASLAFNSLKDDDPMRARLEAISTAGGRAANLTRQLLAFSRKQVLQTRVLDLNHVLATVEKMLMRLLGEDIKLSFLTASAPCKILCDPGQIEQVVMNLVVNARDAMPHGGTITLETGHVQLDADYAASHHGVTPGPHIMLAVSDTGIGMDPATQTRIFEPFFTTKEVGKGTGLGLSTVWGIVTQSAGHIWVYSEPGQGTTFRIHFPRVDREVDSMRVEPASLEDLRGSETILLVEDDGQLLTLLRSILRGNGYNVIEAQNGGEAFLVSEQFQAKVHLLLTDVVMPRMSGRVLAERIQLMRPDIKVLYMSGYADDAIVHHGVLDAAVAFLPKPITPDALLRKVREVLNARN
jgi:signal transduction histidine kinase/ActR/RegA family two-component response regulator